MAAFSRPRVRSSSRRSASLDELPPTLIQQNLSDNTRLGKRPRDPFVKANDSRSIKKPKLLTSYPIPPRPYPRTNDGKSATASGVVDAGAQVEQPQIVDALQSKGHNSSTLTTNGAHLASQSANNPAPAANQIEKRTLRSQAGGSRSRSELSWYFPNYDELVNDEPREPEFFTAETRIQIIDEPAKASTSSLLSAAPIRHALNKFRQSSIPEGSNVDGFAQTTGMKENDYLALNDTQRIEFPTVENKIGVDSDDPLGDEVYAKAHRRAERQEKQLRNIEKERAMHEKVQLERLLECLKGHDWLKVMGISGVTDGEKKSWEPKRDYFILEVELLLEKFREWKEEEKRRRTEREERLQAEEGYEEESQIMSEGGPPNDSDVDACAARQLHREAVSASGRQVRSTKPAHKPAEPLLVQKPFASFYEKPHLREAALGKHRRGRTRLAFGQPIPDIKENDFGLPQDILTPDALRARARSRRAARRESKA